MRVTESAAYLKGLADGMKLDESTNEGKMIVKMLDVITEMADRITALEDENDELYSYLEEMAEDIVAIEDDIYGDGDEAEYDDLDDLLAEDDEFDEDDGYYELECPSCGEKICFADDVDIEKLACPACGELVGDVEFSDEECDGKCDDCECAKDCEE